MEGCYVARKRRLKRTPAALPGELLPVYGLQERGPLPVRRLKGQGVSGGIKGEGEGRKYNSN